MSCWLPLKSDLFWGILEPNILKIENLDVICFLDNPADRIFDIFFFVYNISVICLLDNILHVMAETRLNVDVYANYTDNFGYSAQV